MRWLIGHLLRGVYWGAEPVLPQRPASDFRYAYVLPSPLIEQYAREQIKAVRFKRGFGDSPKWWEFERFVEIDFADSRDSAEGHIADTCGACGMCCEDIPTHQIAIYMSETEQARAKQAGHDVLVSGHIKVDGERFAILAVKANGNCAMLGPSGCTLGERKPLWCKIYHCEKYQNRPYLFEKPKS